MPVAWGWSAVSSAIMSSHGKTVDDSKRRSKSKLRVEMRDGVLDNSIGSELVFCVHKLFPSRR